jgi:hypothetical protein
VHHIHQWLLASPYNQLVPERLERLVLHIHQWLLASPYIQLVLERLAIPYNQWHLAIPYNQWHLAIPYNQWHLEGLVLHRILVNPLGHKILAILENLGLLGRLVLLGCQNILGYHYHLVLLERLALLAMNRSRLWCHHHCW